MSLGKVVSYMEKRAEETIPKADGTRIDLPAGKGRVKGSKLEHWRITGLNGGVCIRCFTRVSRLTIDHIIPIQIISSLDNAFEIAVNDEDNFQFLCEICNRLKSGKLDIRNQKTAQLLVKYMQPYL